MVYQTQYTVCAILLFLVTFITYSARKKTHEIHNYIFSILLVIGMVVAVNELSHAYVDTKHSADAKELLMVTDYLLYILYCIVPFLYALYAITLNRTSIMKLKASVKHYMGIPILIAGILIATNPFTKFVFFYSNNSFVVGNGRIVLYAIEIFYAVVGIVCVLGNKSNATVQIKVSMVIFFIIGVASSVIQYAKPEYLVQSFGISICALLLMINLHRPEDDIDRDLGIFNRETFERMFQKYADSNQPVKVIMIHIEDVEYIIQNVGNDVVKQLKKNIAHFLEIISASRAYYMHDNTYFIMVPDSKKSKVKEIEQYIENRFNDNWIIEDNKLFINHKMMIVDVPKQIAELDTLYFAGTSFYSAVADTDHIVNLEDMDLNKLERKLKVEKILKRAIAEDNFFVYYQPIYSFDHDRIISAEALLRLKDPDEGFIGPDEFIPIAEQNGSIIQIGKMVFEKTFRFMSENDIRTMGIDYIEINLSVVQCMQERLVDEIKELMDKYNIDASMINLEITETAAMDSPKLVLENLNELFHEGISISLDDFGTGYSNILSLMSMPLDIIKLDKSLIDLAQTHEQGANVIDSSVAMVKKMGMRIVAEGIEQQSQIPMLQNMGVDYLQGYYFSRPLPEKEFVEFIINQAKQNSKA